LWLDAVIDPIDTRKWISLGLEAASNAPAERAYSVGVLQT
jgi:acetyl-CoA carboxylase carboxyltransferase component